MICGVFYAWCAQIESKKTICNLLIVFGMTELL